MHRETFSFMTSLLVMLGGTGRGR